MSAIDYTPTNINFLSPLSFTFRIKKIPTVNFFVQKVNIPQISFNAPQVYNPMVRTPITGDHLNYEPLEVTFKVDEDLKNYIEVFDWIRAMTYPETPEQYKQIRRESPMSGNGIYSDVSIIVHSSTKMPNYEIVFTDAIPVSLSGLFFQTTDTDVKYITGTATFKYTNYSFTNI